MYADQCACLYVGSGLGMRLVWGQPRYEASVVVA